MRSFLCALEKHYVDSLDCELNVAKARDYCLSELPSIVKNSPQPCPVLDFCSHGINRMWFGSRPAEEGVL